ncbi:MAG: hypothetical protein RL744_290 [Pseudomonadota bacterium]|jgi:hypothetical protein
MLRIALSAKTESWESIFIIELSKRDFKDSIKH